ncbi:glycosyl hydrolase family 76-domain-containing protein [Obelidium mucronatum]|nr:glycosyl hydrolase family 76-domain-containing protein [Obelidium mucronatum]
MLVLPFLGAVAFAQQTIDLSSKAAVVSAAKAAMGPLKQFFPSNNAKNGAWIEQYDDGHWLVQWHESGIYWDLFYKYMQYSGDTTHLSFVDQNIQLSAGSSSDFLDGLNPILEISGRWNDDIAWWALAAMTATETFGSNAIVAKDKIQDGFNPTYFSLANNTFYEIWMNWDAQCGGGEAIPLLKSTITNVEEMELGARLYAITRNPDYKSKFDQIYEWLKNSGLISSSDYTVYDSVTVGKCDQVSAEVYSYHSGELLSALSRMYQVSQDQSYLSEAHKVFAAVQRQFVDSKTNILYEPACQLPGSKCKSPTGYSFPVFKGLADLHQATTNATVKAAVTQILHASAKANFAGCDSNWYCIRNLPKDTSFTLQNGTNPRDQFETVSILNALAVVNGAKAETENPSTAGSGNFSAGGKGSKATGSESSSNSNSVPVGALAGGVAGGLAFLISTAAIIFFYRRNRKQSALETTGVPMADDGFLASSK